MIQGEGNQMLINMEISKLVNKETGKYNLKR